MKLNIQSIDELKPLAEKILALAENRRVFIFNGNLGTGKTTFIKEVCKLLGVTEETSSPTYSIVNEYLTPTFKIYHIDLYRLKSVEEAFEIGLEDYLYSNNFCFIEWPDIAEELLPDEFIRISIEKKEETKREFTIEII